MKIHFLGDLHGNFQFYNDWLNRIHNSYPKDITIQLGDMGIGFNKLQDNKYREIVEGRIDRNKFIRGNHDSPEVCNSMPNHLGDFGIFKDKIFFISGAWSIDREWRTAGKDWWYNEELTIPQCEECFRLYDKTKPDICISHDCPEEIKDMIVPPIGGIKPCRTSMLMDDLLAIHRPRWWIFAHYHVDRRFNYKGTEFICLNTQQTFTMDID